MESCNNSLCMKKAKKRKILRQRSIRNYLLRDRNDNIPPKGAIRQDALHLKLVGPHTPKINLDKPANTYKVGETRTDQFPLEKATSQLPIKLHLKRSDPPKVGTNLDLSNKPPDMCNVKSNKHSVSCKTGFGSCHFLNDCLLDLLKEPMNTNHLAGPLKGNSITNESKKNQSTTSSPKHSSGLNSSPITEDQLKRTRSKSHTSDNKENCIRKTTRAPNEIRTASLVHPVLFRDPPQKDLRRTLSCLGIYRNYLEESGFHVMLAGIGEELVRSYLAEESDSDTLLSVCMYCGFRSESRLVLGNHFDVKHKNAFRKWPYSRRMDLSISPFGSGNNL